MKTGRVLRNFRGRGEKPTHQTVRKDTRHREEKNGTKTAVAEKELSDTQREVVAARNSNITTGISGLSTKLDEVIDVVIDEGSDIEGEPDLLRYEVTVNNIERDRTVVYERVY